MSSISREYRPKYFADITGQESVKETLRLEVSTGKIANAYIFGGPRGVGKTTCARIFANALNCVDTKNGEPCGVCTACIDFQNGRMLDVIEMDAASNTGVDNIRENIIEHVRFAPMRKYKVYIIDEAHMLSTSSWNALLKTVEEPPAYAKFIFSTTEVHRIPLTIISRCQRFDFKRIADDDIAIRLRELAKKEKVEIEDMVIRSIVTKSDGCLRDGETLLGQLISLGEKKITVDIATLILPISRLPIAANILRVWSVRNLGEGLSAVAALEDEGIPFSPVFDDIIQAIRLLILSADSDMWKKRLEAGDEGQRAVAGLVGVFHPAELTDMALLVMERRRDAKNGADQRFCLELVASAICLGLLPHTNMGLGTKIVEKNSEVKKEDVSIVRENINSKTEPTKLHTNTFSQFRNQWPAIIRSVQQMSASLAFVLKITNPVSLDGNILTLQFQYPFHKEKILGDLKNRRLLDVAITQVSGNTYTVVGTVEAPSTVEQKSDVQVVPTDTANSILTIMGGVFEEGRV